MPCSTCFPTSERHHHGWTPNNFRRVNHLISSFLAIFTSDASRIYLTGQSIGAHGLWKFAATYPYQFAALVPVCASGPEHMKDNLQTLIHGFQGNDEEREWPLAKVIDAVCVRQYCKNCSMNYEATCSLQPFQNDVLSRADACYACPPHGLDLKAIKNSIKKVESVVEGQPGDPEGKKKVDTPPSKKMRKEVNVAERDKKPAYNNAPPPAESSRDKPTCLRCFGGGWHESNPEQCKSGYTHLSNEEKDKYRAEPVQVDKKSPADKVDSLKAEYQGMVAARKTASRAGSVKSQVLSEDEGSDEELVYSPNTLQVYSPNTHEVNHREIPGPAPPTTSSSSVLSALAEEMGVGVLADALAALNLEGLSGARAVEDKPEVMAAPAVALGSTQHMKGLPVKTPEEYEAEAQLRSAPAADEMQRKVQLMASVIKSLGAAFRKLAAGLVAEGRITAPRGVETLVELAEAGQLPMPAALAADLPGNCQRCDDGDDSDDGGPNGLESGDDSEDEEVPLDEMPEDMVEQPKRRRVTVTAAAAAIQDKFGVTDFSVKGKLHAGTMEAKAYELLKKKMLSGLTEEQLTAMAQFNKSINKVLRGNQRKNMAARKAGDG
ncbi:hypothetical protein CYMTET_48000 [Cymbomonas tetramitiformis]|uniref:Uncharacterized protein n=1 Tax=Cymbomonas tetramitiformis TaxID=36881 RepID=A0AAE0BT72_9CHLO|nr:hypothetical protein CYMTET_48000 [Cymbomonas tetramitiformis]